MQVLTCNKSVMFCATCHNFQSCSFTSEPSPSPDSPTNSHMSVAAPDTFTDQEDEILRELVKRHGTKKWHIISAKMHSKTPRECRKRWRTYLHMCMNKSSWSEEEDRLLIEGHNAYGNRWTEIAKMVPGRTDNAVKNRYNALCKKLSHRSSKDQALSGIPILETSEEIDTSMHNMAKGTKRLKSREDGCSVIFTPTLSRSSRTKHLSIEILGDSDVVCDEGSRNPSDALNSGDSKSRHKHRDAGYITSPKDGQVDMEEVMGWLLTRTPTPTYDGDGNSDSTVTSSTSSSLS
ncbi:hypothetical protein R1sor_022005 [Riccia sorocarpa]|uniref:Uncharacterized protein n=1 Tax=Riccia sorocarpa TaxID=122646 RepID=A0ABD3GKT7_9MARC